MYLGQTDSLVWDGGVPVADVPPPPEQSFPFACLYSDGSQEFASDASSCPVKPGVDLIEVDDLTQVSTTPQEVLPPAMTINVPIATPPILDQVPQLPTLPPIGVPVQFPPAPEATPPAAADGSTWPWWLLGVGAALLTAGVQRRRRRVSR